MNAKPTIYALASAPGKSGVAVFRISGPAGLACLRVLGVEKPLTPRMATLVKLQTPGTRHQAPSTIDSALALYFPAPHSFTGEDVIELHTHGSRAVTRMLLEALSAIPGLRMAEPGEFARRAFQNGKLDLAQAEGLADLIDAETASQHRQAMRQLDGNTTKRVEALRSAALEPLALMEAYIDFPDEEIPESVINEVTARIATLKHDIEALLADNGVGEKIREGLEVVIVGAPNAGKSSLLNVLSKREAAIVSAEAGTTRDLIEIQMEISGYSVTLVDTAGLRETAAEIEFEGIRRALRRAEHADLILHLVDVTTMAERMPPLPPEFATQIDPDNVIVIATKTDLLGAQSPPEGILAVSTKNMQGINALVDALTAKIEARMGAVASPLITRARHREALRESLDCLTRLKLDDPLELVCEELRLAATAIGKITGKIWVDDVLDLVFSRFCIGK